MKIKQIAALTLLLALILGMAACGSSSSDTAKELLAAYRWKCSNDSTVTVYLFPNGKWERHGRSVIGGSYKVSGKTLILSEMTDGTEEYFTSLTIEKYDKYTLHVKDEWDDTTIFYNMDYMP